MIHEEGQRSRAEKLRLFLRRRRGDSKKTIDNIRLNWAYMIDASPEDVDEFLAAHDKRHYEWLAGEVNWLKK